VQRHGVWAKEEKELGFSGDIVSGKIQKKNQQQNYPYI